VVVHVSSVGVEAKHLSSRCMDTLLSRGIQVRRSAFEEYALPDGWGVADLLIYLANHVTAGKGILVLGAAGKASEDKPRANGPGGQPPMGSVALKCQEVAMCPW